MAALRYSRGSLDGSSWARTGHLQEFSYEASLKGVPPGLAQWWLEEAPSAVDAGRPVG